MTVINACILGILEGLTEFIPVSSTGHLIVASHLLGIRGERISTFEIFIQLGAILAVVLIYKERFFRFFNWKENDGFSGLNGLSLLALTTIPALILGAASHGFIVRYLFSTHTVAIGLFAGGMAIILREKFLPAAQKSGLDSLGRKEALIIGLFQCLALWPGISRSACTILGAMSLGVDRKTSVEYSFFAAVPVMFAATAYDLYKNLNFLGKSDAVFFLVGFAAAFVSACLSLRFFLRIVGNHTLVSFGWYRIAVAPLIFLSFVAEGR